MTNREGSSKAQDAAPRALALAGLAFALVAPLTYGLLRAIERARDPIVDPGQILASTHMAFVWRTLVSIWFAAAFATLTFLVARDRGAAGARPRRLALAIAAVGVGLALFAIRFP